MMVRLTRNSPVYPVDVHHRNDLKERDDEQRHRAHVDVENFQPVVSRSQSKDEAHNKGGETYQPYEEKGEKCYYTDTVTLYGGEYARIEKVIHSDITWHCVASDVMFSPPERLQLMILFIIK